MEEITIELIAVSLFTLGALIILISSVGMITMKTPYLLLQASGVAVSMGMFFIFLAGGLYFQTNWAWWLSGGTYFFILLSSPVATHVLALAVYKTPEYPKNQKNEEKSQKQS